MLSSFTNKIPHAEKYLVTEGLGRQKKIGAKGAWSRKSLFSVTEYPGRLPKGSDISA